MNFKKRKDAVTSILGLILIIMIFTSSISFILFWGVPAIEDREAEARRQSIITSFDALDKTMRDFVSFGSDIQTTKDIAIEDGSLAIDSVGDRLIVTYSFDKNYDFNVTGLEQNTSTPDRFTIHMSSTGSINKVGIYWLNNTCFLRGTKIVMADGSLKNVENIKSGDRIRSYDEVNHKFIDSRVVNLLCYSKEHMSNYYIIMKSLDTVGGAHEIRVTPNHQFYVNSRWISADEIKIGDHLFGIDGGNMQVFSLEKIYQKEPTFDLLLESGNTYFTEGLLVKTDAARYDLMLRQDKDILFDLISGNVFSLWNLFFDDKDSVEVKEIKSSPKSLDPIGPLVDDINPVDDDIIPTCFPAGTKITMADNSLKNIEDVKVGNQLLSFDVDSQSFIVTTVTLLHNPVREGVYDINDGFIQPTCDHPFYVRKSNGVVGWASVNPEMTKSAYPSLAGVIMQLEIGDEMYSVDGKWIPIYSMTYKPGPIQTYTCNVEAYGKDANNYFANGILTHNLCYSAPEVTTNPIQSGDVGDTTFIGRGNLDFVDSRPCTRRGIFYGTSNPPLTEKTNTSTGFLAGVTYSITATSLSKGTHYYYYAAAYNIVGWGYGAIGEFLTKPAPLLSFTAASSPATSVVTLSWTLPTGGNDNRQGIDQVMIRYKTTGYPSGPTDGTAVTGSPFTSTVLTASHTGSYGTTYYYAAWPIAQDDGATSNGNNDKPYGTPSQAGPVTTGSANNPPIIGILSGDTSLGIGASGIYSISATDPDTPSDQVQYQFDWDAGGFHDPSSWTSLGPQGLTVSLPHSWSIAGTYIVKAKAKDEHGSESSWSNGLSVIISGNLPPNKPSFTGSYPNICYNNTDYTFNASTTDPNLGNQICFNFSWGDGTTSGWTSFVGSGGTGSKPHNWSHAGIYEIRVKAKDNTSLESSWSDPRGVQVKYKLREPEDNTDPAEMISFSETFTKDITATNPLEGAVRIDLYSDSYPSLSDPAHGKVPFGRIWLFDLGYIIHTFFSNSGISTVIYENGGVISTSPYGGSLEKCSNVFETSNTLVFRVTQIIGGNKTGGGGSGLYKLNLNFVNTFMREMQSSEVYHFKIQMSGDYYDLWYAYFKLPWTPEFALQSGTYDNVLLYNNGKPVKLIFLSALIKVNLEEIL